MKSCRRFSPFNADGIRTYLTISERKSFLQEAQKAEPEVSTFCQVLAFTGARISEVLALMPQDLDPALQCIVIRSLKKRGKISYRAVPVPKNILSTLIKVHGLDRINVYGKQKLWPWSRTTAWSRVAAVMKDAGLTGICATSRGLRHTFGVSAIQSGVPLNMVQKWMGHANIETTSIYTNAVGDEELAIASQLWKSFCSDSYP